MGVKILGTRFQTSTILSSVKTDSIVITTVNNCDDIGNCSCAESYISPASLKFIFNVKHCQCKVVFLRNK